MAARCSGSNIASTSSSRPLHVLHQKHNAARRTFCTRRPAVVLAMQADGTRMLSRSLSVAKGTQVFVAGVPDLDEAKAVLEFAKKYELIDRGSVGNVALKQVGFDALDELAKSIPRGAKVLFVEGDSSGKKKFDPKVAPLLVAAAQDASASQLVVVSSRGSGDAGLFGLFGGNKSSTSSTLTKFEQQVADCGLPYAIVRASVSSKSGSDEGLNTAVATLGSFPASAVSSRSQVADVVVEVMSQNSGSGILEMAGTDDEVAPLSAQVAEALAAYQAELGEQAPPPVAEQPAPAKAAGGLFAFGSKKTQAPPEPEPEAEPEPEPPKVGSGFFGLGRKVAKTA